MTIAALTSCSAQVYKQRNPCHSTQKIESTTTLSADSATLILNLYGK